MINIGGHREEGVRRKVGSIELELSHRKRRSSSAMTWGGGLGCRCAVEIESGVGEARRLCRSLSTCWSLGGRGEADETVLGECSS